MSSNDPAFSFASQLVYKHEGGFVNRVYKDSRGFRTIGVGFNLDAPGAAETCRIHGLDYQRILEGQPITRVEGMAIFDDLLLHAFFNARLIFPNFDAMPISAKAVVVDMLFNLGMQGFIEFEHTIAAIRAADYKTAAAQMEQSAWYHQVGHRGTEDCEIMAKAA